MPRLTDQEIFARIQKAMQAQPAQRGASSQTMESLMQKARERRGLPPTPRGEPSGRALATGGATPGRKLRGM